MSAAVVWIFTGDIRIQYRIKRVDGRENKNGQRRSARLHVYEPNVSCNLNQVSRRRYESPATSWVFHLMNWDICLAKGRYARICELNAPKECLTGTFSLLSLITTCSLPTGQCLSMNCPGHSTLSEFCCIFSRAFLNITYFKTTWLAIFEVLTSVLMKIRVLGGTIPCWLVKSCRRFGGAYRFHLQDVLRIKK
jgi:hypothetical protein